MYNALIIGSGQIAGGYDNPQSDCVLTHAHAYQKHNDFNLVGFYDTDFLKAEKMAKKWQAQAFASFDDIKNIDIISICTPDEIHYESVKQALSLNPQLIFLEKPLSNNKQDIEKIIAISKYIPILVNYSRRFVSEFQEIAAKIKTGEFGEYLSGSGFYGKGFIHNGSHMIDLLNMLIGNIIDIQFIDEFHDFYPNDPTKTAVLSFENNSKFFMQGIDCKHFTIFELDIVFEKARIKILDSGIKIEIYEPMQSDLFEGYKTLKSQQKLQTNLNSAMFYALDNISDFLNGSAELKCTTKEAFEAINHG